MKKILVTLAIALSLTIPLASFAKVTLSDKDLSSVIAQDTVTIDFSHFGVSDVTASSVYYGDNDGFAGATGAGYVGVKNLSLMGSITSFGQGANGIMTIDVRYTAADGATKIQITTPEIITGGANGMTVTCTMFSGTDSDFTGGHAFMSRYMAGIKSTVSPGTITVYAHP